MNIFVVSPMPHVCAQALDDLRLNKMILETAQLLCGALHAFDSLAGRLQRLELYKPTHMNHPCAIWVRMRTANYLWTRELFEELHAEYRHRFGRDHKTWLKLHDEFVRCPGAWTSMFERTPFVNCSLHKECKDVFLAYQLTLVEKWSMDKRPPKWTKRGAPWFFN